MEYIPFGETLMEEHLNSEVSPYLFNGKERDSETGFYYYGARYYDPKISLWLSVDPLVEKTGTAYQYCNNSPVMLIDPTGMEGTYPIYHTVKKGENLTSISNKYKTTVGKVATLNNLEDPNKIYVGQQLLVGQYGGSGNVSSEKNGSNNTSSKTASSTSSQLTTPNTANNSISSVLNEIKALADSHIRYSQSGTRNSLSEKGLSALDCSELVSVYLKKLNIMKMDRAIYTGSMTNQRNFRNAIGSDNIYYVAGSSEKGFVPQVGDIFVWRRSDGVGHTGIVYDVNGSNVTIIEAIGSVGSADERFNRANGGDARTGSTRTAVYRLNGPALNGHAGWKGYFRPITN